MKTKIMAMAGFVIVCMVICGIVFAQDNNAIAATAQASAQNLLKSTGIKINNIDSNEVTAKLLWSRVSILKALAANANKGTYDDIIKALKAANKLMGVNFNPDVLNITGLYLKDNVLTVKYALGRTTIVVSVDMKTFKAGFADTASQKFADAALKTRTEAAAKMGLDINRVHVNEVIRMGIASNDASADSSVFPIPDFLCQLTARIDGYLLTFQYAGYSTNKPFARITLRSFVDKRTGRDHIKEVMRSILSLFNPENGNGVGVASWTVSNGILTLGISLQGADGLLMIWGRDVPVTVDLQTGRIKIDPKIVDAVTKARRETALKLCIGMSDVHVNSVAQLHIDYMILDDGHNYPMPVPPYIIGVSTPKFNITYSYSPGDGKLRLTSLINRQTGINLYQNAVSYLMKIVNPDTFNLADWSLSSNGGLAFVFTLKNGSKVRISVDPVTGVASMPKALENAILDTRKNIANRMGMALEDVHIAGIGPSLIIYDTVDYPAGLTYRITATASDYTLVIEYTGCGKVCPGPIYETEEIKLAETADGVIVKPRSFPIMTLKSFVDNKTGKDHVKAAIKSVVDLLNPENAGNIGVASWSVSNGILTLGISLQGSNGPIMIYGRDVPVTVNLQTGEVTINPKVVEAVKKVREETSKRLGVSLTDVHVNSITQLHIIYMMAEGYPTPELPYRLCVSTPRFNINYEYTPGGGDPRLLSLTNRKTGVDLLKSAIEKVMEEYDPSKISLTGWKAGEDNLMEFTFDIGQSEDITIKIDMDTGRRAIDEPKLAVSINKEEVSAIKEVEELVLQQALDTRFVGEMAQKTEALQRPQD